ncbi:hypothetical protein EU244_002380 [Rhodococcus qingshengii]|jgi:hypothetical protein|uniref:hypothetical protein n=1 Tax=Rhodococcus qingshengii TaxID=334542 RepID=UPI0010A65971|nr:hypothetical protein [Rhodococcus qingshengii]THJ65339.1 hypothetical protein EU244_30065 [Rhodococcus qingshengii]
MEISWHVVEIDDWSTHEDPYQLHIVEEPLGTKEKFWVTAPDGNRYLFKYARIREERTLGEDWVEWAVHQLANLLSIPTATAIPAMHRGRRGVLSLSILSEGERLIHGNELLAGADAEYDSQIARQNSRYTVAAVKSALGQVGLTDEATTPVQTGFDAWAGYLLLDAWVAGRDRHHENWAAIERGGALRLSPSFDHGNALGFQEPDSKVSALAQHDDLLAKWANRGRSHHFSGRPSLVDLAQTALQLTGPGVPEYWLGKLEHVSAAEVSSVLAAIPSTYLSDNGRTFRAQLLSLNRERIIHGD